MSEPTDLLALAERVEGASGPDRELDREIGIAVGRVTHDGIVIATGYVGTAAYTTSVDAAMRLVPEGVEGLPLSFKLERFYFGNGITKCRASVWDGLGGVSSLDTATEAATPALAIVAACLRARAQTPSTASAEGE